MANWKFPDVEDTTGMFENKVCKRVDVPHGLNHGVDVQRREELQRGCKQVDVSQGNNHETNVSRRSESFNGNVSKWKFPKVMDMAYMFQDAKSFEGNGVENWKFPYVHDMTAMFKNATSFNGDISVAVRQGARSTSFEALPCWRPV